MEEFREENQYFRTWMWERTSRFMELSTPLGSPRSTALVLDGAGARDPEVPGERRVPHAAREADQPAPRQDNKKILVGEGWGGKTSPLRKFFGGIAPKNIWQKTSKTFNCPRRETRKWGGGC